MKSPNLFIVGFQKCGSSSLFDVLTSHSEISGTHPKETYFLADKDFDLYNYEDNIKNESASWDKFIKIDNETVVEASVCNFYQKNALEYIKNKKDTKVIFVIRDPIQRFISVYKYLYGKINGIPSKVSIDDFFDIVTNKSFDRHILKYAVEHGKYYQYIKLWESELGKGRIHIVSMKYLINNSEETMLKVYNFLSISNQKIGEIPHKNKSKSFIWPEFHRQLVKFFGGSILSNRYTKFFYNKIFLQSMTNPKLNPESIKQLKEIYKEEYKYYSDLF